MSCSHHLSLGHVSQRDYIIMRDKKCCRLPYQSRLLAPREAQQATSIVAAMFSRHMLPHEIQTCDTKSKSLVPVLFRQTNIGLVPSCFSEADSWNVNPAAASWPLLLNAQLSNTSLHHPKRASMQAINFHQIASCHQGGKSGLHAALQNP